jgi:DNA invertase Pin-like site-specific DNA recombinase
MPKAISYIRFSSGKQAIGSSHERQRQAVNRWLDQNPDYSPSDLTYEDLGKSGYHGEHIKEGGGWAKLLEAVKAGLIQPLDVVLVEAMDRTGRLPPLDMIDIIRPVLNAGIAIITLDDGNKFDKASLEGSHIYLLVAKIQAAHGYSKTLSERTKASYEIRRERARKGEKIKRFAVAWLTTDGELKQHLVPYVKQVFDLYISGVGKNAIANRLREYGIPELALMSAPTIDAWLQNRAAIGYWNDIPGVYPPVVTPEVFLQAQKRRQEMKTKPPTRTSKSFLVGLVKCGVCGANLVIHNKDGKPNNMRCLTNQRLKDVGCSNKETIPYQVVHHIYLWSAPSWIDRAMKVIELSDNDKRKLNLTAEREVLSAAIGRLVKLTLMGHSDELETQYQFATERRKAIDIELDILNRKVDGGIESASTSIFEDYESAMAHDQLAFTDPIQLSSLLKQAGYSITVQPGKKLYLPDDDEPWVYTGVARRGNTTLGYRIHDGETEYTISPTIPDVFDVRSNDTQDDQFTHMMERGYKHVKSSRLLNPTGKRNIKGMTIEKFESADAAMKSLLS